ncbi:DsbA family protein [Tessaracoccus antarcticus]|uniref:Thioredoxin n=1 Tax=Tessaracoccus antarcticus TaxID=2479848 RepID=A0A3M0FWJ8_9ACTN|nr:thioredoxin domain-containing protein [Tessaracoccus antarcticus]RMB57051.1 thioredoxin [Tessaracoccus antarcticus]
MANTSSMSRREVLRQQQEREEETAKRNRRILFAALTAVALVVVAIGAVVIVQALGDKQASSANQQTPPNATERGGFMINSQGAEPAGDIPHLIVYEDYQCPACASREAAFGAATLELIDKGDITVEIRTAFFLDNMLRNDSSERAAMAAAAADAVGKYREYHAVIYKNQPTQEGVGYTDQQLRVDFPTQAGITGEDLTKFQELYDSGAFRDFVKVGDTTFRDEGITGTPTYMVGSTKLEFATAQGDILIQPMAKDLLRAITEANK